MSCGKTPGMREREGLIEMLVIHQLNATECAILYYTASDVTYDTTEITAP